MDFEDDGLVRAVNCRDPQQLNYRQWEDMPVIRSTDPHPELDAEERKRFHYAPPKLSIEDDLMPPVASTSKAATDPVKPKAKGNVDEYTRLELDEDVEGEEVHMRTNFLFDDEKDMTPLSQMQATKNLLSEGQRIAYVGLCKLVAREIIHRFEVGNFKELQPAVQSATHWANKIMGRLYLHMDVNTSEQRMFDRLTEHGVTSADLVPSLITTHVVPNPQYDPNALDQDNESDEEGSETSETDRGDPALPSYEEANPFAASEPETEDEFKGEKQYVPDESEEEEQGASNLIQPLPSSLPGVSTTLTPADKTITLDIRWTVLCDLFLALIADSVYDARSRVLLGAVAEKLELSWSDVIRFERRLTEALAIQEGAGEQQNEEIMEERSQGAKKKRLLMMAAAGLGGGLVIGLSAGLLAPMIGAGIGATLGLLGVSGTTTFLAGTGGAAIITTSGVLSGGAIASRGMLRRTASVRTFEFQPLHNNKRVSCFVTVPGFMQGLQDDVRLPFSVLDPVLGDVFSLLWEPETIVQTGDALKILTSEILTQAGQQILAATIMTALMAAMQIPIMLTKLAYLIDNPWSNALDRAKQAGRVLADVLINRSLGVRPISLIGFSLGARVIYYALAELARTKNFGIVQDVYLLGACMTVSKKQWKEARGVVAGRFVNGYATNDWILGYLFRATTGGIQTVAGLRPVEEVPEIENVDLTELVDGHMSYRSKMPVILKHLGFQITSEHFDEPEQDVAMLPVREVLTKEEEEKRRLAKEKKNKSFWKWKGNKAPSPATPGSEEDSSARPSLDTPSEASESPVYDFYDPTSFDTTKIREQIAQLEKEGANELDPATVSPEATPSPVPPPHSRTPSLPERPSSADAPVVTFESGLSDSDATSESPRGKHAPPARVSDHDGDEFDDSDDAEPGPVLDQLKPTDWPSWDRPKSPAILSPVADELANPFAAPVETLTFGTADGDIDVSPSDETATEWGTGRPANPWS